MSAVARRIAGPYSRRSLGSQIVGGHLARSDSPLVEELREEVAQLRGEVAELREKTAELDDVQNRLDFAERLLSQGKERP
ncbi:MAG TPA: hypothetical protein VJU15_14095 [Gemmatimonadales bacterium]|nr:hypothetical protein [Gemmatimonadales bacterium]